MLAVATPLRVMPLLEVAKTGHLQHSSNYSGATTKMSSQVCKFGNGYCTHLFVKDNEV